MRLLCIALLLVGVWSVGVAYGATTVTTPRYTTRELIKLHNHKCVEDEYMVIPARYVNPRVTYNTPDVAYCVHPDNIRVAPLR